ncbi:hypothetical protein BH24ACT16_BH24ACT16_17020 [soil metagenome]
MSVGPEKGYVVLARRYLLVMSLALLASVAAITAVGSPAEGAASLPNGFETSTVAGGLDRPTVMALAPDGRVFVAEQGGYVRIVKDGTLLDRPFLRIPQRVDSRGERGVIGLTLDSKFDQGKPFVYVYYTARPRNGIPPHNVIFRFRAGGDRIVPGTGKRIARLPNLIKENHNGGALSFGKDGRLYAAVGENNRKALAQNKNSRFGKMLRMNRAGKAPRNNPFYRNPRVKGVNKTVWALGLRNPYSFAVQPGTNYGWPVYEGPERDSRFRGPFHAYRHQSDGCNAVTGGAFYNPDNPGQTSFPDAYTGDYLFADICQGFIRRLDPRTGEVTGFASGLPAPVDLKVGSEGDLYYLSRGTNSIERIRYAG